MTALSLGVLAYPVTRIGSFEQFAAKINTLVAEGATGASLLVLPEYAAMECAAIGGVADVREELARVVALAPRLDALFAAAARAHGVWVLPGSYPRVRDGAVRNVAPVFAPDGTAGWQDKRVMTRFEAECWGVAPGRPPCVVQTPWGRVGVAICYDCEFPPLVRAQAEAGAFLIAVPACTDTAYGFSRVRLCARARAIENQCFVAVAPTVGEAPHLASLDANVGAAGVYGPCDRGFPADGIIVEGVRNVPGWVFASIDPAALAAVREDGAVRNFRDWPEPVARAAVAAGGDYAG